MRQHRERTARVTAGRLTRAACVLAAACAIAVTAGCQTGPAPQAAAPSPEPAIAPPTAEPTETPSEATASADATPSTPEITIGWVGDTTPGSKYGQPPQDGRALFARVRKQLQAPDLMVGNLEGTFGTGGKSKSDGSSSGTSFSFQAPIKNAAALSWAGFDVMSLANNHAFDYFEKGLAETRKALEAQGIGDTGLPGQITVRDANGVKVAFVAFSPYRWNASVANIESAQALIRKAKQKADVVVVLMHVGAEGADKTTTPKGSEKAYGEFRGNPREFSHAMVDAGASLVLGSGPHVVRGVERYNGKLIAYSLGNFAGWGNFGRSGNLALSGLLTVRVDKNGEVLGGRWLSLKLAEPGVPTVDSASTSLKLIKKLSAEDFTDTFKMDKNGEFTAEQ